MSKNGRNIYLSGYMSKWAYQIENPSYVYILIYDHLSDNTDVYIDKVYFSNIEEVYQNLLDLSLDAEDFSLSLTLEEVKESFRVNRNDEPVRIVRNCIRFGSRRIERISIVPIYRYVRASHPLIKKDK